MHLETGETACQDAGLNYFATGGFIELEECSEPGYDYMVGGVRILPELYLDLLYPGIAGLFPGYDDRRPGLPSPEFYLDLIYATLIALNGRPDYVSILRTSDCNKKGLTTDGAILLDALMDAKMIIDVDHLSLKALNQVLDTGFSLLVKIDKPPPTALC